MGARARVRIRARVAACPPEQAVVRVCWIALGGLGLPVEPLVKKTTGPRRVPRKVVVVEHSSALDGADAS